MFWHLYGNYTFGYSFKDVCLGTVLKTTYHQQYARTLILIRKINNDKLKYIPIIKLRNIQKCTNYIFEFLFAESSRFFIN